MRVRMCACGCACALVCAPACVRERACMCVPRSKQACTRSAEQCRVHKPPAHVRATPWLRTARWHGRNVLHRRRTTPPQATPSHTTPPPAPAYLDKAHVCAGLGQLDQLGVDELAGAALRPRTQQEGEERQAGEERKGASAPGWRVGVGVGLGRGGVGTEEARGGWGEWGKRACWNGARLMCYAVACTQSHSEDIAPRCGD